MQYGFPGDQVMYIVHEQALNTLYKFLHSYNITSNIVTHM